MLRKQCLLLIVKLKWYNINIFNVVFIAYTVHSTPIPHFPQNSEENSSFARKLSEEIMLIIHKIPRGFSELIKFLKGKHE